jgi:hypothetical protein
MGGEEEVIEINGPGGLKAAARGESTPKILFAAIAIGVLVYLQLVHHDRMESDNKEMKQAFAEMVYMMSLSAEDRAKLHMDMPSSLRVKVRNRPRED